MDQNIDYSIDQSIISILHYATSDVGTSLVTYYVPSGFNS